MRFIDFLNEAGLMGGAPPMPPGPMGGANPLGGGGMPPPPMGGRMPLGGGGMPPPPPMGGGMLGGAGGGQPPQPPQNQPVEIETKDVWQILKKLLSSDQNDDIKSNDSSKHVK